MRIEIVQELTGRYMKISVEQEEENFGTTLLKYNEVKGILGAEIHCVDNEPRYLYEIGDMICVSELFEKKTFHSEELECFVEQLIQILNLAGDYFLDEKNLVLISDYMFYDETQNQLKIAYLDGFSGNVADGIAGLMESFMKHMDHHDRELVFLVYGIHKISKDSHFTLNQLSAFIQEGRQKTNSISVGDIKGGEEKTVQKLPVRMEEEPLLSVSKTRQQKMLPGFNMSRKKAVYLAAGIFLFLFILRTGLLDKPVSGEPDMLKVVVFGFGIAAVEGYLFQKEKKKEEDDVQSARQTDVDDSTTVLVSSFLEQTVVLEEAEDKPVFINLIPEDWHREEIKIRKSPFFIGKDRGKADGILADGEVSRVHAKIVMEENKAVIIDQESTNGTFINGSRVVPWERRRIMDGDRIGISSVCYRVELSHS